MYKLFEKSFLIEWLFCFALVVLARLPYLLSSHVFFDGDEAMLGIMACDLLHLRELPIYFYGQLYGFSFFEVLSGAFFISFLGNTMLSLKLGGMLLFSLGIQRLMRLVRKTAIPTSGFILIAIALSLFPAWLVWGTKLRGGYITAFVCVCFLAEYLFKTEKWSRKDLVIVGAISALIVVAQPFFLIIVLPVIIYRLFACNWREILVAGVSSGLILLILYLPTRLNTETYSPAKFGLFHWDFIQTFFIDGFWSSFTGFYTFTIITQPPFLVKMGGISLAVLFSLAFIRFQFKTDRDNRIISLLIAFGMLLSIISVTLAIGGCRYVLPFHTGMLLVLVFMLIRNDQLKGWTRNAMSVMIIAFSFLTTTGYEELEVHWVAKAENDHQVINELISKLTEHDFKHGFTSEWQLCWQLNYLCYDQIEFRNVHNIDRVQRMIDGANECYFDDECDLAVIGTFWPYGELNNANVGTEEDARINPRYFILANPSDSVLQLLGFHLPLKGRN